MTTEEFKSNIKWWESKRWIFNLLVGITGIYGIYIGSTNGYYPLNLFLVILIIIFGVVANIFYSLGTLLEILDWYYFKNRINVVKIRWVLFIVGIAFSCFQTYIISTSLFVPFIL